MNAMSILTNVRYWILVAAIIGFAFGDIGGENDSTILIVFLMLMMCFSLTRLEFKKGELAKYKKKVLIAILLCSVLSTFMTLGIGLLYDHSTWLGWVILACVPCAISVVSATLLMGGDMKLIMLGITAVYLLSFILTPSLSYVIIGDAIDPLQILKYVLLFILIPMLVSRPLMKLGIPKDYNTIIINFTFAVFAVIGFGRSRELFMNNPELAGLVILGTIVRLAVAHFILEYSLRYVGVKKKDRIPYSLILIWRNSGLALTLTLLLAPDQTNALAPAIVSMVLEQIYFMFMIWYYEKRVPDDESPVTS